ncbi:MAG: hypothetical protein CMM48_00605 [Rhodospirillaceae bacterium]|nr:hypothetical protein [Rhodospirillaceae bacterium]
MQVAADFPSVPVTPVSDDMHLAPLEGAAAWYGPDLEARPESWIVGIGDEQIADLRSAIAQAEATGLGVLELTAENFPLPSWGDLLTGVKADLFNGRGFTLLRGFPVDDLTPLQRGLGYFGIGAHLGKAIPQNAKGHALGHVCDIGVDKNKTTGRGYQSNARLKFHTDSADIVGLLCVRQARSGGLSSLVSSITVYNELLKRRPDYVRLLMGPIYRDRREEVPVGQGPWYCIPAFNPFQQRLFTTYVRSTVRKAARFSELPPISAELNDAMDMFDDIAADPAHHLNMDFMPGDIQLVCNHFILHSRTGFEDFPDLAKRRHLLRLHLACPDGPQLPPVYENLRGYNEDGRPAGTRLPGVALTAPLEPVDGGPGGMDQRKRDG